MSQVKIRNIKQATIQVVGNKTRGEGLSAASVLADVSGSSEFLTKLIEKSFMMDDLKCFSYIETVELNPVYQFVSKMFDDGKSFLKQSVNIATFLYDQSIHPNIRSGELYVLHLDCEYDEEEVEAIAILKSERKDPFLATDNDGREISVRTIYGTGMKGLDKGCLVLNIDREKGYVLGTVDNTNNGSDAQYWTDSFLHVSDCEDDYHQTERLTDMLAGFAKQVAEESEAEAAVMAKKATYMLKSRETLAMSDLADVICQNEEQKQEFEDYRKSFEEENGALNDEVKLVKKAVNYKPVSRMNVLKIGTDFEVKVLNPEARIEQGEDKNGKWWKLYS